MWCVAVHLTSNAAHWWRKAALLIFLFRCLKWRLKLRGLNGGWLNLQGHLHALQCQWVFVIGECHASSESIVFEEYNYLQCWRNILWTTKIDTSNPTWIVMMCTRWRGHVYLRFWWVHNARLQSIVWGWPRLCALNLPRAFPLELRI